MKHLLFPITLCFSQLFGMMAAGAVEAEKDAYSPAHWAFANCSDPIPPEVRQTEWLHNDLDRFILAKLEEKDLKPSAPATSRELIRRLYFDLIGLPPTPDEIHDFVEDTSPTAYKDLVNRLLEHPGYGERWGRYWLDLARYSDSLGFEGAPEI